MPLRPIVYATTGSFVLLLLGTLGVSLPGAASPPAESIPGDAALNHVVYEIRDATAAEVRTYAQDVVAHMKEAHPEASLALYQERLEVRGDRVHILMETVNARAQEVVLGALGRDDVCRALIERRQSLFELKEDVYLRLITSDPEKERNLGPRAGTIVWSLKARFPRLGEAIECVERVVQHLNATYPDFTFRAYDEWLPRSGGIRIHVSGYSSIAQWENTDARIRRDPVFRELMGGAADAFVEGSFEQTWITVAVQ